MQSLKVLGMATVLATAGVGVALSAYPQPVSAQTQGMERRDDRRGTRQTSRDAKQACKAGDEKSRAECRQGKHEVKQAGRQGETPNVSGPATTSPTPPAKSPD
jgi:hypothetical protein